MRFGVDRRKQACLAAGLLVGVATAALLGTSPARANDFLGVDVGPVSIGIGPNTPTYYSVAPAPSYTTVTPSGTTYVSPPVVYQTSPTVVYQEPMTTTYAYTSPTTTYTYTSPDYYALPTTVVVH